MTIVIANQGRTVKIIHKIPCEDYYDIDGLPIRSLEEEVPDSKTWNAYQKEYPHVSSYGETREKALYNLLTEWPKEFQGFIEIKET